MFQTFTEIICKAIASEEEKIKKNSGCHALGANVGIVQKWGQVSVSLRFFLEVEPQGYRVWEKGFFFVFNFLGKEMTEKGKSHALFPYYSLNSCFKNCFEFIIQLKNICHFYFLSVFLPYRNFALMATNLCVFLFFFLFFFLHAVPCVGTLNRE